MASPRKLHMPTIEQPAKCRLVPIAEDLLPFFRLLFDQMRVPGSWIDQESATRAYEYFGWQEAMMLCDFSAQFETHSKVQVVIMMMLMSDGQMTPQNALDAYDIVQAGIEAGSGTPEHTNAVQELLLIDDESIGMRTNQLETYQKALAELIGGSGVVEDPD